MKALVLDDSKTMRTIIKRSLQPLGFEAIEAEHGADALERLAETGPVDIALVDWNTPVMNGLEFVCRIRQDARFDSMLVMMVTTESQASSVMRALEAGADEYLMKPFTREALVEKLELLSLLS
jgi:two-component system chemotaxis response regulator CheY